MALLCGVGSANTGTGNCPISIKEIDMFVAVPAGSRYTKNELLAFVATFQGLACSPTLTERVQVLKNFVQMDSDGADRQTAESPYGNRVETRRAIPGMLFTIWGDRCLNKYAVEAFDGQHKQWEFILVEKSGSITGAAFVDGLTGATTYGGYSLTELFVGLYGAGNGTDPDSWQIGFRLNTLQWDKNWWHIDGRELDGDPHSIEAMTTIELENMVQDPVVTGTYVIKATVGCGSTNMGLDFPTLLSAANLRARNLAGVEIPITSSTVNGTTGYATVVLDTDPPEFVAGEPILFDIDNTAVVGSCFESETIRLPNV